MSNLYEAVRQMNNDGAKILTGDITRSIFLFQVALTENMKGLCVEDEQQRLNIAPSAFESKDQFESLAFHLHYRSLNEFSDEAMFIHENVFARPLLLPQLTQANSESLLQNFETASLVVLFNLAIAVHCRGLTASTNAVKNEASLRKAKSIYVSLLKNIQSLGYSIDASSGTEVIDLIVMATLNNLAQTGYAMHEYQDSKTCFNHLAAFVVSVRGGKYSSDTKVILDCYDAAFSLNIVLFITPTAASCA